MSKLLLKKRKKRKEKKVQLQFKEEELAPSRGWALRAPGWAAQENEREALLWPEELRVNMLQSLFSLQLTSHT